MRGTRPSRSHALSAWRGPAALRNVSPPEALYRGFAAGAGWRVWRMGDGALPDAGARERDQCSYGGPGV